MWDWVSKLAELKQKEACFVIATVTHVVGSTPRDVGAKMIILGDGHFFGTIGGGKLESLVLEDAKKCFAEGTSRMGKYPLCIRAGQCCGGSVEVFLEHIGNHPLFYLYGAGHVGQALCKTLQDTPFCITLIDERPEWIEAEGVPDSVLRYSGPWQKFNDEAIWSDSVYVAVMTFSHDLDLAITADVARRNTFFQGLIGSQTKWSRFQQRLKSMEVPDDRIARIHCPIGLDIGGKSPQEVAISVSAQLLKLHYQRAL